MPRHPTPCERRQRQLADRVSSGIRSQMMASVRSKNTKPELVVRKRLFSRGFRYRLHRSDLPGCPDLVLPKFAAVIFVHGCFWHQHGCPRSKLPATRRTWWKNKLQKNRARDERAGDKLIQDGWRVLVVWECSLKKPVAEQAQALEKLTRQAERFLHSDRRFLEIPARRQREKRSYSHGQGT